MPEPFLQKSYFLMTMDPVHVGTGGYRLGRVDNTIMREPSTNLPKLPGSSIAGVCRAYTAMHPKTSVKGQEKYPGCAGKGGEKGEKHCAAPNCPVCVAYGFSKGESGKSLQGMAQFSDGRILLFPVYSKLGPVWLTSRAILADHGIDATIDHPEKFKKLGSAPFPPTLNFGWLLLESEGAEEGKLDSLPIPPQVRHSSFLVSDALFSKIVNDNLEVRTSVAIDPKTGAAEEKALFTYEAIPRATILWFDVTYNNPIFFKIADGTADGREISLPPLHGAPDPFGRACLDQMSHVASYVELGIEYLAYLGLGGMSTRGFGRLKRIGSRP